MSWIFARHWDLQTGGRLHLQVTTRGIIVAHVDPDGAPPIFCRCDDIAEASDIVRDYLALDRMEAAKHV